MKKLLISFLWFSFLLVFINVFIQKAQAGSSVSVSPQTQLQNGWVNVNGSVSQADCVTGGSLSNSSGGFCGDITSDATCDGTTCYGSTTCFVGGTDGTYAISWDNGVPGCYSSADYGVTSNWSSMSTTPTAMSPSTSFTLNIQGGVNCQGQTLTVNGGTCGPISGSCGLSSCTGSASCTAGATPGTYTINYGVSSCASSTDYTITPPVCSNWNNAVPSKCSDIATVSFPPGGCTLCGIKDPLINTEGIETLCQSGQLDCYQPGGLPGQAQQSYTNEGQCIINVADCGSGPQSYRTTAISYACNLTGNVCSGSVISNCPYTSGNVTNCPANPTPGGGTLIPTPTPTPVSTVTVQGHFVDQNGLDLTSNIGQGVTINGGSPVYQGISTYYSNTLSPGSYTVTTNSPAGYTLSYSSCVNCTTHTIYTSGTSVTVSLLVAGNYADIYFKYTPPLPTSTPPPAGYPVIRSLKANNSNPVSFNGIFKISGRQDTENGSKWLNPLKIRLYVQQGTYTIKKYYIAFYDKNSGALSTKSSFIADIKKRLNPSATPPGNPKNGFLLAYGTGEMYGEFYKSPTDFDWLTNNFYVWDKNTWRKITTTSPQTIYDGTTALLTASRVDTGTEAVTGYRYVTWEVKLNKDLGSKNFYTPAYVVDSVFSWNDFNPDLIITQL